MLLGPNGVALTRAEREEKLSTSFAHFVRATSASVRQCQSMLCIALTLHEFQPLRVCNIGGASAMLK